MNITVFNGNKIFAEALVLYLCMFLCWLIIYSLGINIIILLLILAILFSLASMHLIGCGRKIKLDHDGVEISFLWIKKKCSWDQLIVKQMFDDGNLLGVRIPYTSGIILSYKESSRP